MTLLHRPPSLFSALQERVGQVRDMTRAGIAMWRVLRELRRAPAGSLVHLHPAGPSTVSGPLSASARELRERARRWVRALNRSQRVPLFRGACLARSIALHRLLEGDGIQGSHVCIGVKRADSDFEAHAWVEIAGMVIGDDPRVTHQFSRFASGLPA